MQVAVVYKRPTDLALRADVPVVCNLLLADIMDEGAKILPSTCEGTKLEMMKEVQVCRHCRHMVGTVQSCQQDLKGLHICFRAAFEWAHPGGAAQRAKSADCGRPRIACRRNCLHSGTCASVVSCLQTSSASCVHTQQCLRRPIFQVPKRVCETPACATRCCLFTVSLSSYAQFMLVSTPDRQQKCVPQPLQGCDCAQSIFIACRCL